MTIVLFFLSFAFPLAKYSFVLSFYTFASATMLIYALSGRSKLSLLFLILMGASGLILIAANYRQLTNNSLSQAATIQIAILLFLFVTMEFFKTIRLEVETISSLFAVFSVAAFLDIFASFVRADILPYSLEILGMQLRIVRPVLWLFGDTNWLAVIAAFFYGFFTYYHRKDKERLICLVIISLSFSRIVLATVLADLFLIRRLILKKRFSKAAGLVVGLCFFASLFVIPLSFLGEISLSDSSLLTRRIDTVRSLSVFMESPIVGNIANVGAMASEVLLHNTLFREYRVATSHINVFAPDILAHFGLVGLAISIVFIGYSIKALFDRRNLPRTVFFLTLITLGLNFHGLFYKAFFWIFLGIVNNSRFAGGEDCKHD